MMLFCFVVVISVVIVVIVVVVVISNTKSALNDVSEKTPTIIQLLNSV